MILSSFSLIRDHIDFQNTHKSSAQSISGIFKNQKTPISLGISLKDDRTIYENFHGNGRVYKTVEYEDRFGEPYFIERFFYIPKGKSAYYPYKLRYRSRWGSVQNFVFVSIVEMIVAMCKLFDTDGDIADQHVNLVDGVLSQGLAEEDGDLESKFYDAMEDFGAKMCPSHLRIVSDMAVEKYSPTKVNLVAKSLVEAVRQSNSVEYFLGSILGPPEVLKFDPFLRAHNLHSDTPRQVMSANKAVSDGYYWSSNFAITGKPPEIPEARRIELLPPGLRHILDWFNDKPETDYALRFSRESSSPDLWTYLYEMSCNRFDSSCGRLDDNSFPLKSITHLHPRVEAVLIQKSFDETATITVWDGYPVPEVVYVIDLSVTPLTTKGLMAIYDVPFGGYVDEMFMRK